MQVDLTNIGVKESFLIVFAASIVFELIFAGLFQTDIYISPFLLFQQAVMNNFIFIPLVIFAAVAVWWASIVLTNFFARKFFSLESEYIFPAYAICYTASLCLGFAINALKKYVVPFDKEIAGFVLFVFAFLLYATAIKDVYEFGWRKAVLVLLPVVCIIFSLILVGYLTGISASLIL